MITYTGRAAAPMATIPVGAGALVGPDAGGPSGLVDSDGDMLMQHDALLADHEARIGALEAAAHGHEDGAE